MEKVVSVGMLDVYIALSLSPGTAIAGVPGTVNAGIGVAGASLVGISLSFVLSILIWNRSRRFVFSVVDSVVFCVVDSNVGIGCVFVDSKCGG